MNKDFWLGLSKIGIGAVAGVSSMKPNWIDPSWIGMLVAVYGAVSGTDQTNEGMKRS